MKHVAVVTGGGRGLGRAFAIALARSEWKVAVVSRSDDELITTVEMIRAHGGDAIRIKADVTQEREVREMVTAAEARWEAIDLLVNCAGAGPPFGPLWECEPGEWWRNVEVNLRGPMLCCGAVLPGMLARGSGRIINVASGAGTFSIPHMSAYVTGKAALIRMTEVLADELRARGVSVFAIEPGTVRTAMAEQVLQSEEARRWLPWFAPIFEEGRDVTTQPGERLVLRLASGECDGQSGRFFMVGAAPDGEGRDVGVLRLQS